MRRFRVPVSRVAAAVVACALAIPTTAIGASGTEAVTQTGAAASCSGSNGTSWNDGCAQAPAGPPQHPDLLKRYGRHRPPWNVAGVEYHVGHPAGQVLTDWQQIDAAGITVSGDVLRCDGPHATKPSTETVVLDGIDFTLHGGVKTVYVAAEACSGLTIANSRFGSAEGKRGCAGWSYYQVQSQNAGAPISLVNNTFDMTDCGIGQASVVSSAGPVTMKYNYFGHVQGQVLQAPAGAYDIDYRFNFIEDACYFPGNHMNFQEFGSAVSASSDTVSFNTTYQFQATPCGGEEFQFYGNAGGSQQAATLSNNTIIALDTGRCRLSGKACSVSYAIHGTGAYRPPTVLTGPAVNRDNYFDRSGMFDAYYPRSMAGWTSSGNIDMNSGQTIPVH